MGLKNRLKMFCLPKHNVISWLKIYFLRFDSRASEGLKEMQKKEEEVCEQEACFLLVDIKCLQRLNEMCKHET